MEAKIKALIPAFALLIAGCGGGDSTKTTILYPAEYSVEVFTLGPVKNALVKDSNNQIGEYDEVSGKYVFKNPIKFPVTVSATSITYVDVDYDSNKTANDLLPKFTTLKSFNSEVNLITNLYYSKEYNESNITSEEYAEIVKNRYNIDLSNSPQSDEGYAKALFGAYNYFVKNGEIAVLDDIDSDIDEVNVFFSQYLNRPDITAPVQYYSMYDALLNLDKRLVSRADSLHKPEIKILRNPFSYDYNSSVDIFDIYLKDGYIYTASGHEELSQFLDSSKIEYIKSTNINSTITFGSDLYAEEYNSTTCLFLADVKDIGVKFFDITSNTLSSGNNIYSYIYEGIKYNITNDKVNSVNGYVSPQETKRLLSVTTNDNGFYLINLHDVLHNCTVKPDANLSTAFLISPKYDKTLKDLNIISSAIRNDGTYLYATNNNIIYGYDLSILDRSNIISSKKNYYTYNADDAYNILLVNNDNEMFVSTNSGVQVYDISNNNNISFVSEYKTEGAQSGYYPRLDFYDNMLFFTDGYKGLKVIKYDSSFQPMLCGVAYFAPSNNSEELAKVNSVKYENGYLYIGVDSFGLVRLKADDILFTHCK